MPRVNESMYVERVSRQYRKSHRTGIRAPYRDWWIVKHNNKGQKGKLVLGTLMFPEHLVGETIKIKVERVRRTKAISSE